MPEDKNYPYMNLRKFTLLVDVSKKKWCHLYTNFASYLCFGHLVVWEKLSVMFILSYDPDDQGILVHGAVADQVNNEKVNVLKNLLKIYNAAHRDIRVRLDTEYLIVFVESNGRFPVYEDKLAEDLDDVYEKLKHLINDNLLHTILEYVNAHFLGTPIDLWDYE